MQSSLVLLSAWTMFQGYSAMLSPAAVCVGTICRAHSSSGVQCTHARCRHDSASTIHEAAAKQSSRHPVQRRCSRWVLNLPLDCLSNCYDNSDYKHTAAVAPAMLPPSKPSRQIAVNEFSCKRYCCAKQPGICVSENQFLRPRDDSFSKHQVLSVLLRCSKCGMCLLSCQCPDPEAAADLAGAENSSPGC